MTINEKLKRFSLQHRMLLKIYRMTFGKIKTTIYWNIQREILQKKGMHYVVEISEMLRVKNAFYFLDFGTLLGVIRDGNIIPYDRDVDFGIYFSDEFRLNDLDNIMLNMGFKKNKIFYINDEIKEISYSKGIINIDFFCHENKGDFSCTYLFKREVNKIYPTNDSYTVYLMKNGKISGIKNISINGRDVCVPQNSEEYLASVYTEKWRVPNPKWVTEKMHPNIEEIKDLYGIRK